MGKQQAITRYVEKMEDDEYRTVVNLVGDQMKDFCMHNHISDEEISDEEIEQLAEIFVRAGIKEIQK